MLTITGKNTITDTTIILESGLVIVNHWFMIGARATIGMAHRDGGDRHQALS